jgi:hypothetical protein
MTVQRIEFGDEGQVATRELLARFREAHGRDARLAEARSALEALEAIDRQHGGLAPLQLEDADHVVANLLTDLTRHGVDGAFAIGVALWAIRHGVPILAPEPVVNALAERSNAAGSAQELVAAFSLMQGLAAHLAPGLAPDLERSNPERPWRILHLNLAITAIRTEDGALLDHAFDALDRALPDERAGFYAEALALALAPGIAPGVRERIEARHLKWTAPRGTSDN